MMLHNVYLDIDISILKRLLKSIILQHIFKIINSFL